MFGKLIVVSNITAKQNITKRNTVALQARMSERDPTAPILQSPVPFHRLKNQLRLTSSRVGIGQRGAAVSLATDPVRRLRFACRSPTISADGAFISAVFTAHQCGMAEGAVEMRACHPLHDRIREMEHR